jgi:sulfite exporter TauE/SafE
MFAFGLGTLPNLLLAGLLLRRARSWFQHRMVRWVSGGLVLGFGIAGLANAAQLGDQIRRGLLCVI